MKRATQHYLLALCLALFAMAWSACPDTSIIREARYACTADTECITGFTCRCNVCVLPGEASGCPDGDIEDDSSSSTDVLSDADGKTDDGGETDAGGKTDVDCVQLDLNHGGHAYRVCTTPLTHIEATKVCDGFGSDLFLPETVNERSVIYGALQNHPKTTDETFKDLWLRISRADAISICNAGCGSVTEPIPIQWAENQPGEEGSCIRQRKTDSGWEWAVEGCDDKAFAFLCETREDFNACNALEPGLFPCAANCTQVEVGSVVGYRCCEVGWTWNTADNACRLMNACDENPCDENEECIESENGHDCICAEGFSPSDNTPDAACVPDAVPCAGDQFDTGSACIDHTDIQTDCQKIASTQKTNPDGLPEGYFPIDPDGYDGKNEPFMVWCDLDPNDGDAAGWTQIVYNKGKEVFGGGAFFDGFGLTGNKPPAAFPFENYAIPCEAFDALYSGEEIFVVVRVTISNGDDQKTVVRDYFQPLLNEETGKACSLCDMLVSNENHHWWFPGDEQASKWMTPDAPVLGEDAYSHGLGGSKPNWPLKWNGRTYLNFWGSGTEPGGCCLEGESGWKATTTVAIKVFTTSDPMDINPTK